MISMRDYVRDDHTGSNFAGMTNMADVNELNKALSAGYQNPRTDGGNALRVESLEQTMKVLTFSEKHIVFWRDVPKMPAYSTSEEYNVQTSYGLQGGIFTNDGELPQSSDASYERRVALVKFMGVVGEVTHSMTIVKPAHGDVIALETKNKAIVLMSQLNAALFNGNAGVIPAQFDGIEQLMRQDSAAAARNIIDLRGGTLSEDKIEEGANIIVEGFGVPSDLYLAPRALSDVSKAFYPRERVSLPAPERGVVGIAVDSVRTNAGVIALKNETFLRSGGIEQRRFAPLGATSNRAPTAPSVAGAAGAVTGSLFAATDAGTYQYKVTAVNRFGESVGAQESGGVAVVTGDGVTLTITDGGGTDPATGYRIYRSAAGGVAGSEMLIGAVPRASSGTTTFVDINQTLPGTSNAYMLQMNMQSLAFKQLLPMMKIPLATLAASIRWMQLVYGVLTLYAPLKNLIYTNVNDSVLQ